MNNITHILKGQISLLFIIICSLLFSVSACSDEWNDHYDASAIDIGTLWEAIAGNEQLSNFARVAEACGYDRVLNGSQTFTVFAPVNEVFPSDEADRLIVLFQEQKAAGTRSDDNSVVRQFLQNHIALYKYPVSSLTHDTIAMMNDKYELLTGTHLGDCELLSSNGLYNNGILFTLGKRLDYFHNVFEYLGHDTDLDSVYQFFNRYSVYEFDENKSVPGEIVDGMTIYLDSVSRLNNPLFNELGLINSEDSTYWLIAPTNEEWKRLVENYQPYFNYHNNVSKRDSLVYTKTRLAIMDGAFFSKTLNKDEALQDSAVSTKAPSALMRSLMTDAYPYYTYYKPFEPGGVFDGTEEIVCSNGRVLKASTFNISPFNTFMQTIKVEAENILSQDTIINAVEPLESKQVTSDNPFYNKLSQNSFVEVKPISASAQVSISFKVPNVLSNVKYDIYAVMVPVTAIDPSATEEATKPNILRTTLFWSDQNGRDARKINNKNIYNDPAVVDTVLLVKEQSFATCSYGLTNPQVRLMIRSNVTSDYTMTHSSTLRIDCIIFKPHDLEAFEEGE